MTGGNVLPVRGRGAGFPAGGCWPPPLKAAERAEVINKQ